MQMIEPALVLWILNTRSKKFEQILEFFFSLNEQEEITISEFSVNLEHLFVFICI